MEEEAYLDVFLGVADLFTEHGWQQHQVVVVDPDQVIVLDVLRDGFGEKPIYFLVGVPCQLVKGYLRGMVVEEWPQDLICGS